MLPLRVMSLLRERVLFVKNMKETCQWYMIHLWASNLHRYEANYFNEDHNSSFFPAFKDVNLLKNGVEEGKKLNKKDLGRTRKSIIFSR